MKISETPTWMDDNLLIIKNTHSADHIMNRLRSARDAGLGQSGEMRHVGTLPIAMVAEWCREAGVKFNDVHARADIVKKKMMSGEFSAFRNWEGSY